MKNRFFRLALVLALALTLLAALGKAAETSASRSRSQAQDLANALPLAEVASISAEPSWQGTTLSALDPTSPTVPVRFIFIHHSTGENWLNDTDGGLGIALMNNNYFVSDTNYGWGPPDQERGYDQIGDHTDIPDWYSWFTGPHRDTYLTTLYSESDQHSGYSRLTIPVPSGENQIVMFKSCFPNSNLGGNPDDPPASSADHTSDLTVANAKRIYLDLLDYFATRPDKLFVVITAPPLESGETTLENAANARAFNNWLFNNWLQGYAHNNVAVFDFYNVLTSDGGSTRMNAPDTNDLGWADGNHHRYRAGAVEHVTSIANNYSAYWGGAGGGSHPTAAGNQKATAEYIYLLNIFYHRWQASLAQPNFSSSTKQASRTAPVTGDTLTFTLRLVNTGSLLADTVYLTDVVPDGLSYVPGTLGATSGIYTDTDALTLTWSGVLSPTPVVTLTYAVTVSTALAQSIANTAVIAVPGYLDTVFTATVIANGYPVYMPVVMRNYSPTLSGMEVP